MSTRTLLLLSLAICLLASPLAADPWVIRLSDGVPERAALEALDHAGVLARGRAAPNLLIDLGVPPDARARRLLRWAEPVGTVKAMDVTGSGLGWVDPIPATGLSDARIQGQDAFDQIDVPGLQDLTSGSGVLVAIVDSGVDFDHPDTRLTDCLVAGWDWVDDDADPQDGHGHGTRVAGIVAAVLEDVEILPLRILGLGAAGTTFDLADAITYAADEGADVINVSLGGPLRSFAVQDAVDYARSLGASVVAAGGNDDTSALQYPAASSGVIAVAGVDGLDVRADFVRPRDDYASNYGAWIDISAPAIDLETTSWPDDFVQADGTSYATPLVTATLAASRALGKSRDDSETDLLATAVDIDDANPGFEGLLGAGRILASSAAQ